MDQVELGIQAYLDRGDTGEVAAISGLPRARFLDLLIERGVVLLDGPSTVREELTALAEALGDQRLRRLVALTNRDC